MEYKVHRIGERTPVLLVTVEGTGPGEVIFYSHLDKQPSRPKLWSEGLHPLKGVRRDPWLYGRGKGTLKRMKYQSLILRGNQRYVMLEILNKASMLLDRQK